MWEAGVNKFGELTLVKSKGGNEWFLVLRTFGVELSWNNTLTGIYDFCIKYVLLLEIGVWSFVLRN